MGQLAELAGQYGVTLCVKAHVGAAIHDTPTTLRLMEAIPSPAFGIDMDPSHIYRAGENPVEALAAVIERVRHVHIRDCKGRQQGPGKPELQANGRGDIDLVGYIRVLHESGYEGPVDLEIIGAKEYPLTQCAMIAAESRAYASCVAGVRLALICDEGRSGAPRELENANQPTDAGGVDRAGGAHCLSGCAAVARGQPPVALTLVHSNDTWGYTDPCG